MNTMPAISNTLPLTLTAAIGVPLLAAACFAAWRVVRRRRARGRGGGNVGLKAARSTLKNRVMSLARPYARTRETPPTAAADERSHRAQGSAWLRHVSPPAGESADARHPAATVLVADDDVYVNHWLSVRLGELGLHVVATTDATNALLGAERFRPDLIVLDVNMPTGSGAAVCELLATSQELRGVPVIMYTGVADAKTQFRCQSLGARYVMKSPGSWNRLRSEVCELLGLPAAHETEACSAEKPSCAAASS